jgi:hypothetical protein
MRVRPRPLSFRESADFAVSALGSIAMPMAAVGSALRNRCLRPMAQPAAAIDGPAIGMIPPGPDVLRVPRRSAMIRRMDPLLASLLSRDRLDSSEVRCF